MTSDESPTLLESEKALLAHIETGVDLLERPFAEAARSLETSEAEIVSTLQGLIARGIVRRFGVLLHHRRAGFQHNEMTAWQAPDDQLERWGNALAALPQVSHAYQRPAHPQWPYNLYAMFHAHSPEEIEALMARTVQDLNPATPPRRLQSLREFKKQRLQYFSKAFYSWAREE